MLPRVKSGIPGLDKKLGGGIPENSTIVLYGPPKSGKSTFAMQFIYAGLLEEEPGLFITTSVSIKRLKQEMLSLNIPISGFEEKDLINYIDMFSIRSGKLLQDTDILSNIMPGSLTNLMVSVSKSFRRLAVKSPRIRTVFDSLSSILDNNPINFSPFLQTLLAKCEMANSTTLLVYTEGVADKQTKAKILSYVDGAIYLDGKGTLIVESLIGTPSPIKAKYTITDKGIAVS